MFTQSLRSVIEPTFGVWKNRWHILRQIPSYDINDQMLILVAITTFHNFIRMHDRKDNGFNWVKITPIMMMMQGVKVRKTLAIYMTRK